jgi:hypothetical protein
MTRFQMTAVCLSGLLALVACGGGSDITETAETTTPSTTTPVTLVASPVTNASTAGILCSESSSVFNSSASVNATSTSSWKCSSTQRTLTANGLPDHAVGTFPNGGNPNTISAQAVSASLTLSPTLTTSATTLGGPAGTIAYIRNGVKVDAGTGGSCNSAGTTCSLGDNSNPWSIEALGQTSFNFGTDTNNAHVQPGGAYHYHGMPEGYIALQNKGQAMTLVGWAADGFPIYARYGYTTANDSGSTIKVMVSSYRLKTTPDANRPATSLYPMGTFKQDYEYVAGSNDGLDACNGRVGVTPEFPQGTYHYYATDSYPYLQRCVMGQVSTVGGPPAGGTSPAM